MISAATAATAVLMVTLVRDHGLQYLLAATVLAGVLQVVAGLLRLGELMRFVSRSVITGFVNALAILIFMAQLPELIGVPWLTYVMVAAGLAIIYLLPRLTRIVPSPLVCIVVLSAISIGFGLDLRTVGDMGELPSTLPVFLLPEVPLNLDTLLIILPYSAAIAIVGLLESLMTATIVDDLTDTRSDKNRECVGQGVANFVTGFLGGMAGCAMIGQSVINVKSGGRGRLSTFFAGMFLLFLILVRQRLGEADPDGGPGRRHDHGLDRHLQLDLAEAAAHPPAQLQHRHAGHRGDRGRDPQSGAGRPGGRAAVAGSSSPGRWRRSSGSPPPSRRTAPSGPTSSRASCSSPPPPASTSAFDFKEALERVRIDVRRAHIWDISGVAALDSVVLKFRREGADVELVGMNEASATIVDRLAVHDKPEALDALGGH